MMVRRRSICGFLAAFFTLCGAAHSAELDLGRVVDAIRSVENSPRARIGKHGERGPWQMMPGTWAMFSSKPFWWASGEAFCCMREQHLAAEAEVRWILARLDRLGLTRSAWSIGLVHNAGYGTVRGDALQSRHYEYADRVQAIYDLP